MTPTSPAGMPTGDEKRKSELEMCMRLTGALPLSLSAAYFASKGADHFSIDYQKLMSDLVLIEKNEDCQKELFKQLQKSDKQGENGSKQPPKKKMKAGDRIPKKQKNGDGQATAPSKPSAKLCQNCAK